MEHSLQLMKPFPVLSKQEISRRLNPDNPACGYYGYVGNRPAVDMALDYGHKAFNYTVQWGRDIVCGRMVRARLLLEGDRGVGKTDFARRFAHTVETCFVEVDGTQLGKADQLIDLISRALREQGFPPLVVEKVEGQTRYYGIPPLVLFIDEIHALSGKLQDQLLKMTEENDGFLRTPTIVANFRMVCFIIATTDSGKLRPAFKNRFTRIPLERHSSNQVATIVRDKYPRWSQADCNKLTKFVVNARQALDFAEKVVNAAERLNCSISKAIDVIANRLGYISGGLSKTALEVLRVLADADTSGLSRKALCVMVGIEEEQFMNDILPSLMKPPAYIRITNKHYITESGRQELRKNGYDC